MNKKAILQFLTIPFILALGALVLVGLIFLGGLTWLLNVGLTRLFGLAILLGIAYGIFIKGININEKSIKIIALFVIIALILIFVPFSIFSGLKSLTIANIAGQP